MPQNFIACDRDQTLLMPPDLREWLPEGHLAWFVLGAVEEMDLDRFYAAYRSDGHGRAAFEPQMMVALLLYSYAVGERSSRRIERRLAEDVAFRVIAANRQPDHATIARFRARHNAALGELFGEILILCERAGLLGGRVVAIDSTKLAADASGHANLDYEAIAERILAEAAEIDAAEDELYGERRGDELPAELADPERRKKWLQSERQRLLAERRRRAAERPQPAGRLKRLAEAAGRLEQEHEIERATASQHRAWRAERQAEAKARGKRMSGRPPATEPEPPARPQGKINTTDLDSRPMRTARGFIQGYSAHAATNCAQIVLAAELTLSSPDGGQLEPIARAAESELAGAGAPAPKTILADAGYWRKADIDALAERGIEALVPPDGQARRRRAKRARASGLAEAMRRKLRSGPGADAYRQRQWMIEPVFAQTKVTRGIDRFQRRGLAACRAEWRLIAATHNLLKLWRAAGAAQPA